MLMQVQEANIIFENKNRFESPTADDLQNKLEQQAARVKTVDQIISMLNDWSRVHHVFHKSVKLKFVCSQELYIVSHFVS